MPVIVTVLLVSGCVQDVQEEQKPDTTIQDLETRISDLQASVGTCNQDKEDNIDFLKEYSIALNNFHVAFSYLELAVANRDYGNYYAQTEEYYYDTAMSYYDTCKEQTNDAREMLNKAERKLNSITGNAPDEFFAKELDNRIEQTVILTRFADSSYDLCDFAALQIYELAYGDEEKATEYFEKYNDEIYVHNDILRNLSTINNEIDIEWDQDWYPLLQDSDSS